MNYDQINNKKNRINRPDFCIIHRGTNAMRTTISIKIEYFIEVYCLQYFRGNLVYLLQ